MVKATRKCSIDGCENKHDARGYCKSHWRRWKRHGDPLAKGVRGRPAFEGTREEFFWQNTSITKRCWIWSGAKDSLGYGRIKIDGSQIELAHRYSYELHKGPIASEMFIDHLCHTPSCVNPNHLREATHQQNMWNRKGARKDSKTGVRGVRFREETNNYQAAFAYKKKRYYVGTFETLDEAKKAVEAARAEVSK